MDIPPLRATEEDKCLWTLLYRNILDIAAFYAKRTPTRDVEFTLSSEEEISPISTLGLAALRGCGEVVSNLLAKEMDHTKPSGSTGRLPVHYAAEVATWRCWRRSWRKVGLRWIMLTWGKAHLPVHRCSRRPLGHSERAPGQVRRWTAAICRASQPVHRGGEEPGEDHEGAAGCGGRRVQPTTTACSLWRTPLAQGRWLR